MKYYIIEPNYLKLGGDIDISTMTTEEAIQKHLEYWIPYPIIHNKRVVIDDTVSYIYHSERKEIHVACVVYVTIRNVFGDEIYFNLNTFDIISEYIYNILKEPFSIVYQGKIKNI
jgi:hypothetical protein